MKSVTAPEPSRAPAEPDPPANYLDFYGLSKPPFGNQTDRAGYILFGSHRRAFELLVDHLTNGNGLVVLLAEEGVGKTEALRSATAVAAEAGRQTITVTRPHDGRVTLTQLISALNGKPSTDASTAADVVRHFEQSPGKALVAEDAELLPVDCVKLLLPLAQIAPDDTAKAAIIVSSAIDLSSDAARPDLIELSKLARNTIRMSRLGPAEIRQYIERSLWIAGGTTRRLITADAMKALIARSGGLPGTVNRLMEAAFTAGFARGDSMITAKTVASAVGPIATASPPRANVPSFGQTARILQIIATGLLVTGASVFLYKALHAPMRRTPSTVSKPVVQQTRPPPPPAAANIEPPAPARPAETLPPDLIAALMKRGNESLELGDIAAARLLFQRAAAGGNAAAAIALGKTFDPNFANVPNTRDPARAAEWYQKAAALGDPKAAEFLKHLGTH